MVRLEKRPRCHVAGAHCEHCGVRSLAVCGALAPSELDRIASVAEKKEIPAGAALIDEGERAKKVFTIVEGILKLYKLLPDGRRQVVGFMFPGDFVGLAFGDLYIYTAEAVTPVTACKFKRSRFNTLMQEYPALESNLLSRVSTELAAAQEQMLLLGRKTAKERLSSFLAGLARRLEVPDGEHLPLPMSRGDIADFLGLTIETVSRTFTAFHKQGLLKKVKKSGVVLVSLDGLTACAGD